MVVHFCKKEKEITVRRIQGLLRNIVFVIYSRLLKTKNVNNTYCFKTFLTKHYINIFIRNRKHFFSKPIFLIKAILYLQRGWIWTSDTGGRKHKHYVYKFRAGEIFRKISTLQKPTFPNISKKLLTTSLGKATGCIFPKKCPPPNYIKVPFQNFPNSSLPSTFPIIP